MTVGTPATMAPNRVPPYKVTKPATPHKVVKPTPRTHEENQERAYIAASRRSDRSLEARMESAKRASEIHKKRTGRYYRITEETVINEQMYEEEDDTPRFRLTGNMNMHMPNTLLQQRAQAMMSIQMENRKLLGQAVNSTLQHNPHFQNQAQFISPGMMQMPQSGYNWLMPSPSMDQSPQSPLSYQHSPYPTPTSMEPTHSFHQRSNTIADVPRQQSQSAQNSPIETHQFDNRRMSMPPQNAPILQSPQIRQHKKSSPVMSHGESYPSTPTYSQHASSRQQMQSQFDNSGYGYDSRQNMSNSMGPLTTALPRDTQQLLDSGLWPAMNSSSYSPMMQTPSLNSQKQQPFYSYRPNSKANKPHSTSAGLDQTLLATASDNNISANNNTSTTDKSTSSNNGTMSSNASDGGFDFGFDDDTNMFGFGNIEPYNPFSSQGSAQLTPALNEEWTSFLDNDMF